MPILMVSMINSKNPYQQRCSIGHGIISNPQNSFYKIWFMIRAYSITQISKSQSKVAKYQNLEQSRQKILHLDRSISFISNDIQ